MLPPFTRGKTSLGGEPTEEVMGEAEAKREQTAVGCGPSATLFVMSAAVAASPKARPGLREAMPVTKPPYVWLESIFLKPRH